MEHNLSRYVCTLWILAAIFGVGRTLCAATFAAGGLGDAGIYKVALERIGPFMPTMSIVCLAGGLVLLAIDLILSIRNKKK